MDFIAGALAIVSSLIAIVKNVVSLHGRHNGRRPRKAREARRRRVSALPDISPATSSAIVALALLICVLVCAAILGFHAVMTFMPHALDQIRADEGADGVIIAYGMVVADAIVALGVAIISSTAVHRHVRRRAQSQNRQPSEPRHCPVKCQRLRASSNSEPLFLGSSRFLWVTRPAFPRLRRRGAMTFPRVAEGRVQRDVASPAEGVKPPRAAARSSSIASNRLP